MRESLLLPGILAAAVAVFAHACFQLAASVLTLLSSHSIGLKRPHLKVLNLSLAYTLGVLVGTFFLIAGAFYIIMAVGFSGLYSSQLIAIVAALDIIIGLTVIFFYYRKGKGTVLWLPRAVITHLGNRAKKTGTTFEAFGLGLVTTFGELPFVAAPIFTFALLLLWMTFPASMSWTLGYCFLATLPLFVIVGLIGSGHKISTIQRWRESNKLFFQFTSGGALIVLGIFLLTTFMRFGGQV